ncbi:MAG: DNA-binding response regulator [Crocinitomicaceae bacterium]|nr:DNA-binding response regulator [Crocinitomicaceae bacterium]|tara:strand:- start:849 stop:1532 length:684 start_codon:yes stop_codon:yes gene_type:complete
MSTKKILLVDDESDILDFISFNLEANGYNVKVASNGEEGISIAKEFKPDLILLDLMMPEMDGIETCERIRENDTLKSVLIAFLTARGEDYSQIAGFDAGADDYILKPIKPKVLLSRVKALLKRRAITKEDTSESIIKAGRVEINTKRHTVLFDGNEVVLPRKEFKLLSLLCSKPGIVHTREGIMDKIWGAEVIVGDRTIDVHIRKIREKLDKDSIITVKGIGYKFLC